MECVTKARFIDTLDMPQYLRMTSVQPRVSQSTSHERVVEIPLMAIL